MCNKCHKIQCSCEKEAISIFGKLGLQGPKGPKGDTVPVWWYKASIVDFTHGDNSKAVKYSNSFPYKTFDAARVAASAGDTIVLMPGTHDVNTQLLTGDGITIYAMPGAIISVNNSQVATAGTLNIQGFGEWHFYSNGINLDDLSLNNNADYNFYFKDLYIHYTYGLSTRVGNINISGENVYIVGEGSTFIYADLWQGKNINISVENIVDSVEDGDSTNFSSNIYIRANIGEDTSYSNISFKKLKTLRRQCIVYLSDDITDFRTTTTGDIEQISNTGADFLGNSTIYVSCAYGASHNFYGRYRSNTPNCIVAVAVSPVPLKVYHEGSIDMQDAYGVATIAGSSARVKLNGIYAAGKASGPSANETITIGIYDEWNILLPIGGVTTGGNLDITGTIINRHNGDSNEVSCIYCGGDTENTTVVRLNNTKMLWTNTVGAVFAMYTEVEQTLEIIGNIATNFIDGIENQFLIVGDPWIVVDNFTDDQIF